MLFPFISANGFPGKRVEAYLAGMMPIMDISKQSKINKTLAIFALFGVRSVLLFAFPVLATLLSGSGNLEPKAARLLSHMYDSVKTVRTLRYHVVAIERIERRFHSSTSDIKVQTYPRKVYYNNPLKKLEILYNSELSPSRAWVKPNVFPYMTISLDPVGNIMRRNQHYTIHELGYDFIGKSIALTIKKDGDGLANFTYHGKYLKNGYNCHLIEYENKKYAYVDYKVGEKETASLIAYKLLVNDYLLRYRNDLLNDFGFLKPGRILKVPSLYCQRAMVYLDEKMMLPVSISLYDDIGLFESYDYSQIEINRPFRTNEFNREFPGYGF
jgi:hypothetical protein